MSFESRMDREVEQETDAIEAQYDRGLIDAHERNRLIAELERDARMELREHYGERR